ncbi:hypothetical protein REPUB_Repub19eG0128300 [Reevesia pubescens]
MSLPEDLVGKGREVTRYSQLRRRVTRKEKGKSCRGSRRQGLTGFLFEVPFGLEEMVKGNYWKEKAGISSDAIVEGSTLTIQVLKELVRLNDPDFVFLMETKNKVEKVERLRKKLKIEYGIAVEPKGLGDGLALWWKKEKHEKEGGRRKERMVMNYFGDLLRFYQLDDIGFQGQQFTWYGVREEEVIKKRLDRAIVNAE